MGVWVCGCVLCGAMSDAMGSKTGFQKHVMTDVSHWQVQSKKSSQLFRLDLQVGTFWTGSASRIARAEKSRVSKALFRLCKKPDSGFSRKGPDPTA